MDLNALSGIFGFSLEGNVAAKALFSQNQNIQKLDLFLDGDHLAFSEWKIEEFHAISSLLNPFGSYSGDIAFHAHELVKQEAICDEISFESHFDKEHISWPFSLSSNGAWHGEGLMLASGNWRLTKQAMDIHIESMKGKIGSYSFILKQPSDIRLEPNSFDLAPIQLKVAEGTLNATANVTRNQIQAEVQTHDFPMQVLNLFAMPEAKIEGLASIDASLSGEFRHITGNIAAQFQDVRILEEVFAKFPPLQAQFLAKLNSDTFQGNGKIEGEGIYPLQIQANIPLQISLSPLVATLDPQKPLQATLDAEGEIASFLQLFVTDKVSVAGFAKAAFQLEGNWNKPLLNGTVSIVDGSYENLDTGAVFQNISLSIEGHNEDLLLKNLQASDGDRGSLKASGKMLLDYTLHFPFETQFEISHATLIHLDYAKADASGILHFNGNTKRGILEGQLTLDEAIITIPNELPPQLKAIDITYINLPPSKELLNHKIKKKQKWPMDLNINLHIPSHAYVKGRDLKSEWRGDIAFSGTNAEPLINGATKIINGEYLFNGRSFISNTGTITFNGEPKKTSLYVIAEREIDDIDVDIILRGLIRNPVVSFRSNPPLSQKEILSWILFNRGLSEITPLQGAELSQSVFTLSGGNDSPDVLTQIRNSIGIDRVDISSKDTEDSNEVSLRVGKYISQGVFVSLGKSITADANQVAIEAKMTRFFKLSAEVGDNADGKISLKWEKDY